jgi:chorismate mutase/prephenate dehydratase
MEFTMHAEYSPSPLRAAYLGPEGAFSWVAALDYLAGPAARQAAANPIAVVACPDLPDVFQAVAEDACAIGFVPLENSLRGTVSQSFDLFLRHDVRIVAELYARISQCLLSREPSPEAIRVVYSHPQPLAQAGMWLRAKLPGIPLTAMESTAAAARRAAAETGAAAVGHRRLAQLYDLRILAEAIEDDADNWTRFVIIAGDRGEAFQAAPVCAQDCRTSLLFTLPDRPGALAAVLNCLADDAINMRKLESRPLPRPGGENWKYAFFADVECDLGAPAYAATLERMRARCAELRVLGAYACGPYMESAFSHS